MRDSLRALSSSFALLSLAGLLGGCVASLSVSPLDDDAPPAPTPNTPVTPPATACNVDTNGFGTINVSVTGLPAATTASVKLDGPTPNTATETKTFEKSTSGSYRITADKIFVDDPIVRTAYAATISTPDVCLSVGETKTITIAYAKIPTSNALWMTAQNSPTDEDFIGYASAKLAASGAAVAPSIATKRPGGSSISFDREGNLWTVGSGEAQLARFDAAKFTDGGEKAPNKKINLGISCAPATAGSAFDKQGNLWVASPCAKEVWRIPSSALAGEADAEFTATDKLTGFDRPEGLAFDKDGNLFVADVDGASIVRFDAASLAEGALHTAKVAITVTGQVPFWLAFDKSGNLWAADFTGSGIFDVLSTDLDGTGTKAVSAAVARSLGVDVIPEGIAFDDEGGLWVVSALNKFARIESSQLIAGGDVLVPGRIIESTSVASAKGLAFFPAPAGLPLYASF